jgi:hypothetical protein
MIEIQENSLAGYRQKDANATLEADKAALQETSQLCELLDFHPEMLNKS